MNDKTTDDSMKMYEGNEPYIFISYSHRDTTDMNEVCAILRENNVRFWYDNGLHSGDDYNYVIAAHLEKATVCLLLLSQESTSSRYVKNELNFAFNHRIPIHTLILDNSVMPIDIEMMLGRIQMIRKEYGYELKLLESLPSELYDTSPEQLESKNRGLDHPHFQTGKAHRQKRDSISKPEIPEFLQSPLHCDFPYVQA